MGQEREPVTLSVYFESNKSSEFKAEEISNDKSFVSKLTFHNVSHPEWASHVLQRVMYVQKVTDFGSPTNDPTQYGIAVVYEHNKVSDLTRFTTLVRMAIENGGISPPHL